MILKTITKINIFEPHPIYHIYFEDDTYVCADSSHKFINNQRKTVKASELLAGHQIYTYDEPKTEIEIDCERTQNGRFDDPEIILNLENLLKIAQEQGMQDPCLVIRFDNDWYNGESFGGVYLRENTEDL